MMKIFYDLQGRIQKKIFFWGEVEIKKNCLSGNFMNLGNIEALMQGWANFLHEGPYI